MSPDETRRLKRIRSRLMSAVRTASARSTTELRTACAELASDIEAMIEGRPVADEQQPDTLRVPPPGPEAWAVKGT